MDFRRVAILGPGLLGASLALAIRQYCQGVEVHLWARRTSAVEEIQSRGLADVASTDLAEVLQEADLVVLTTPIGIMADLCQAIQSIDNMASGCVITDVGSVKKTVMEDFAKFLIGGDLQAIGSHPMAGSEKTGMAHARADLFEGAPCVITPAADQSGGGSEQRVRLFWESLGMKTCVMAAEQHDHLVARISHLPHLMASLMVELAFSGEGKAVSLAGSGFIDSTRIASGAPEMWTEILMENKNAVIDELKHLQQKIGETLAFLDEGDEEALLRLLAKAKDDRDSIQPKLKD